MKLQLAKGVRDNGPREQIVRQRVLDTIKGAFESYGFLPLDTPVLERTEVLASKYAGGAEILKETFNLKDQGDRELSLRYDLTVPMCRYVGMNPNIKMPFKRYQMGPVFRDGPIKLGRYREFWQVDADIVGAKSMMAEAELISMAFDVFRKLGLKVYMEVNSRKLLDRLLASAGVKQLEDFMLSVDKLKKIGADGVTKELLDKGFGQEAIERALSALDVKEPDDEGLKELFDLLDVTKPGELVFNPSLARGLSYYTGTVFEIFVEGSKIKSSVAAGGRYDRMISEFLESKQEFPAVGISFGLDVIKDALESEDDTNIAQVFVIPIQAQKECLLIAKKLREAGIKTDVDVIGRGISKNLNYANALSIPFVIIAGEDELKKKKVTLRDMKSGEQSLLSVEEAIKKLSS